MDQLALGKLMMKAGELPSLPQVANRVIELTNDPDSTPNEICSVICQDHVLASKVLKVVNSAYYGLPRKIATISEAITILGLQTLRTLVIGTSVYKTFNDLKGRRAVKPESIWQHALACAVAGKTIALELGVAQKEHAFMAGLLHDIGKMIFNSYLSNEYSKVIELAQVRGCSIVEAEREMLNTTHTEVGYMVARKWNLPSLLVDPIQFHHAPLSSTENSELVLVVHLADIMAMIAGYCPAGCKKFNIDTNVFRDCNIKYDQLTRMAEGIRGTIGLKFI